MEKVKKKKIRTSKLIMWIFIILFIYVILCGIHYEFATVIDTSIYCACITSVGGITGAIIAKYYNNSNAENIPKIQTSLYKDTMDIRLNYNKKMMKLKKEFEMSSEDISDIESNSPINDISDNVLNTAVAELDVKAAISHEDIVI